MAERSGPQGLTTVVVGKGQVSCEGGQGSRPYHAGGDAAGPRTDHHVGDPAAPVPPPTPRQPRNGAAAARILSTPRSLTPALSPGLPSLPLLAHLCQQPSPHTWSNQPHRTGLPPSAIHSPPHTLSCCTQLILTLTLSTDVSGTFCAGPSDIERNRCILCFPGCSVRLRDRDKKIGRAHV